MAEAFPLNIISSNNMWWNTLIFGITLSLMSLGLALTYSVSKVANFAHGEYAVAGLVAYYLVTLAIYGKISSESLKAAFGPEASNIATYTYLRLLAAFALGGATALLSLLLVFRPLRNRGARPLQLMVASIGLELVLKSIWYIWYYTMLNGTNILPDIAGIPVGQGTYLGIKVVYTIPASFLLTLTVGIGAMIALAIFFLRSMIGISIRATADNPELAEASGINTALVEMLAWFIGGGLTALGGVLWFLWQGSSAPLPEFGWMLLAFVFAAITLGGLSNLIATVVSSFLVAAAFNVITSWAMDLGLEPALGYAVPPAIVIVTLLVAPRGIAPYIDALVSKISLWWKRVRWREEITF